MVVVTAEQVKKCRNVDRLIIAVDDTRVSKEIAIYNFEVMLTSCEHKTGTDRVCEVAEKLKISDDDIVINIQADEPMIKPDVIEGMISKIKSRKCEVVTLCANFTNNSEISEVDVVKVFLNQKKEVFDFKRSFNQDAENDYQVLKHIGIYGFRYSMLKKFKSLKRTENEINRSLEQMRLIDNNIDIDILISDDIFVSVDTFEDYQLVKKLISQE